jgi:hypothetical protein
MFNSKNGDKSRQDQNICSSVGRNTWDTRPAGMGRLLPVGFSSAGRRLYAPNQPFKSGSTISQIKRLLSRREQTSYCCENRAFIRRQPAEGV